MMVHSLPFGRMYKTHSIQDGTGDWGLLFTTMLEELGEWCDQGVYIIWEVQAVKFQWIPGHQHPPYRSH